MHTSVPDCISCGKPCTSHNCKICREPCHATIVPFNSKQIMDIQKKFEEKSNIEVVSVDAVIRSERN